MSESGCKKVEEGNRQLEAVFALSSATKKQIDLPSHTQEQPVHKLEKGSPSFHVFIAREPPPMCLSPEGLSVYPLSCYSWPLK